MIFGNIKIKFTHNLLLHISQLVILNYYDDWYIAFYQDINHHLRRPLTKYKLPYSHIEELCDLFPSKPVIVNRQVTKKLLN